MISAVIEGVEEDQRNPVYISKMAKAFYGVGIVMLFLYLVPMMTGEKIQF